ncbi:hypothetical protein RSOL_199360 [Rhizoctonia solani AG-3 Rhs1AP]|uniref:Uncharacterized protein n=1 Tax=Rhizoctonia solani AG-3 Rhs1AP TaxID=1086054 RepID=X8J4F8_9AGAM|nr:hypothetical protein RSOL_199360 [Rhizoctonia solani AG-3 Rhs1AP]
MQECVPMDGTGPAHLHSDDPMISSVLCIGTGTLSKIRTLCSYLAQVFGNCMSQGLPVEQGACCL